MALFALLTFSSGAFANATLRLTAPGGMPFGTAGVTFDLYFGTGSTTVTSADASLDVSNSTERVYVVKAPGTYRYATTSATVNFYQVSKLIYITPQQVAGNSSIMMEVESGPTAGNFFEAGIAGGSGTLSMFTDQIIAKQFHTNIAGFPAGGITTPTFSTTKARYQVTTQADMMDLVNNVVNNNPKAHLFSLGKTEYLGYDMPIVIVTNSTIPAGATFEQAAEIIRTNGKVTFFHQGQIHGGESSSGEGAMATLQWIVTPEAERLLEKIDYVCVPRINIEGASVQQRGSIYPQTIDMNRDHLRLRAPEIRMLHRGYLEIMPHVTMDGHEIGYYGAGTNTNSTSIGNAAATGGVTDLESTPSTSMNNPSAALNDFALDTFAYNLHTELSNAGIRTDHYENGRNGWTANHGIGRAYYGLMGSISFLVEVRGAGSHLMQRRAFAHLAAAKSLMNTLYDNDVQVKKLVNEGRDDVVAKGKEYKENEKVHLYQYASGAQASGANGPVVQPTPGSRYSRYAAARYTLDMEGNVVDGLRKTHAINDKSHFDRSRPTAYVIPKGIPQGNQYTINYDYLLGMLAANRIEYYEIEPGFSAPVRQYYYVSGNPRTGITPNATVNNNVLRAGLRAEETVTFTNGAYVIPMDQVAGAVALCTLEPDISNSNGYNGTVVQGLNDDECLILISHDIATGNYPYYRLEKNEPREVLPDKDKPEKPDKPCKHELPECIEDLLDCLGCNSGFGLLALIIGIPFVVRKRK